jgi:hypothetical protein
MCHRQKKVQERSQKVHHQVTSIHGHGPVQKLILQSRHRGTPPNVEYEVKWEGLMNLKNNEWLKAKDITPDLMKAYKETLQRKNSPSTQLTPTTVRMIPVDLINGDKTNEDTFKIMEYTKDDLLKYPEAKIIPDLPDTWIERNLIQMPITRSSYRHSHTSQESKGHIISCGYSNMEVICSDNTVVDLDIHQLEFMTINSENRTQQEETMLLIRKASYEAYLMTEPQS